jgi:hypothetical protein
MTADKAGSASNQYVLTAIHFDFLASAIWNLRSVSCEVAHFSRVAATAHSRGRQPTEKNRNEHVSREVAAAEMIAAAAKVLVSPFSAGLRPQLCAAVASRLKTVQLQN